ncbi:FAD-dependent monooxygenase [Actinoalloteichus fjordicus]|nr:FAD-dependent monooxygenase [Actinoalloteichus fjordicus]
MAPTNTDILISGAGIAGPVLACMLRRHGFNPTVVDRMPAPGVPGVEADIYGPAVDVLHDLGVLGSVWQARTAIKTISHLGPKGRAIDVDITAITGGSSDRHIEIMRDDLVEILHRRSTPDVEHLFDDSIQHLEEHSDGVHVTFDRSDPREFHLVIGADGLHSKVRELAFGASARHERHLGAYQCVIRHLDESRAVDRLSMQHSPGRSVIGYPRDDSGRALTVAVFLADEQPESDLRDPADQRRLIHAAFADADEETAKVLDHRAGAEAFRFGAVSQVRMDTWSRGRTTLVGDAGYATGGAVSCGATLAIMGAHVLAGELAAADGDHRLGFARYEQEMRDVVGRWQEIGPALLHSQLGPGRFGRWVLRQRFRLLALAPTGLRSRLLTAAPTELLRLFGQVKEYAVRIST